MATAGGRLFVMYGQTDAVNVAGPVSRRPPGVPDQSPWSEGDDIVAVTTPRRSSIVDAQVADIGERSAKSGGR